MKPPLRSRWKRPLWARLFRAPQSLIQEAGAASIARYFFLPFIGGWGICLLFIDWANAAPEPLTGTWVSWALVHGPFVGLLMWLTLSMLLTLLPKGPQFGKAQVYVALGLAPLTLVLLIEVMGLFLLDGSPLQGVGWSLALSVPALVAALYCARLGGLTLQALGLSKGAASYAIAGISMALAAFIPFFLLARLANLSVL